MGVVYKPSSLRTQAKNIAMRHNVSLRVIDNNTQKVVQEHTGHNAATNGLLTGMAHYLTGDGILNQGWEMLSNYIPRYISLGTMGLYNQEEDELGYPAGIGISDDLTEVENYSHYMTQCPGYGADGYDAVENNQREYFGLGPMFSDRDSELVVDCELITEDYGRQIISYRDIVPETSSEIAKTVDVVFSAMIPMGMLTKFKEGRDYIFITEAGLWSRPDWTNGGDNGLLAGYRIAPPNDDNWDMSEEENRDILRQNILRVGPNQVVQVIWKIQLGALEELVGIYNLYDPSYFEMPIYWDKWDED